MGRGTGEQRAINSAGSESSAAFEEAPVPRSPAMSTSARVCVCTRACMYVQGCTGAENETQPKKLARSGSREPRVQGEPQPRNYVIRFTFLALARIRERSATQPACPRIRNDYDSLRGPSSERAIGKEQP